MGQTKFFFQIMLLLRNKHRVTSADTVVEEISIDWLTSKVRKKLNLQITPKLQLIPATLEIS